MLRAGVLFFLCLSLSAQKPIINAVTNAASFAPQTNPGHALAAGGIATIFGQNLAPSTAQAQGYPLPTSLAGTSVTVAGIPAPLFYVSPTQINFQTPYAAIPPSGQLQPPFSFGQVAVIAIAPSGQSDAFSADTLDGSTGIFTTNSTGCGQGAILNVAADGSVSPNSPANSASPGSFVSIYFTGLGRVNNPPADGYPSPANPPAVLSYSGYCAYFDGKCLGSNYVGRAPGFVGLDQVNAAIPYDVRQGCYIPVQIGSTGPALISIHSGGGQCVDPPIGSEGQIQLTKSIALNDATVPESDTITAVFPASPGRPLTLPPVISPGDYDTETTADVPLPCAVPGHSTLNAGAMTISGPGSLSSTVQPSTRGSEVSYSGSLPMGSVQPGNFHISFSGGPNIGAFDTALNVGSPIQITSQFPKGKNLGPSVTVNWTGGTSGEVVTLSVSEAEFYNHYKLSVQAPASAGTVTLQGLAFQGGGGYQNPFLLSSNVEIDVEVGPDPANPQIVAAPGLTLGAVVTWKYQYRFVGLLVQ